MLCGHNIMAGIEDTKLFVFMSAKCSFVCTKYFGSNSKSGAQMVNLRELFIYVFIYFNVMSMALCFGDHIESNRSQITEHIKTVKMHQTSL